MSTQTPPTSTPPAPIIDNVFASEVYADSAIGFLLHNGNITITFFALRSNYSTNPSQVSHVVVGRVVMPIAGAQGLAIGLYDYLKKMGLDPNPPKDPANVQ